VNVKTRKLGWTELHLTTIGLGTWAMGGGDWAYSWGPQDDAESRRAIDRALDLGINWLDTAPAYGLGHAEEVVGRALKGKAQRPIIATKCGLVWNDRKQITPRLRKASVRVEVEASLRRLQVETIDLYQIHWPWAAEELEEGWGAIAEAVREGKVRYAGVSNFSVEQIQRVQAIHPVASLQPPYSLLVPEAEQELLPFCAARNLGVVVYSPLQKGLLTGKITPHRVAQFPPDDHRRHDRQFQEPRLSANLELVAALQRIAAAHGHTVAHLAISWVLRRSEVTAAIVGARGPAQIEEVVGGADWELSAEDLAAIGECLRNYEARKGE
jgi:aryl-alcohol dehydrogenase-like predicted oxidoreductase